MMRMLASLTIMAIAGIPINATAALVNWATGGSITAASSLQFNDSNPAAPTYQLKVTAYSTSGALGTAAQANSGQTDSLKWLAAQLQGYGGGFGVRNACFQANMNCSGGVDTYEGLSPEHAVDNQQLVDVVIFQLPTIANTTWAFSNLTIGWRSNDFSPEINVWVGGSSLGAN